MIYPGWVLDLSSIDLEEIANALADQTDYEHQWLINPRTGEIAFWSADTGIDGQMPVDLDELDLLGIGPLPSWVWYQDMADFAEGITDKRAGRRLARAIQGRRLPPVQGRAPRGASGPAASVVRVPRHPGHAPCRSMARRELLVDGGSADRFLTGHPDPGLP